MFNQDDIQRVLAREDTPLLSLYLNVDAANPENQSATPEWMIWLKNSLRDIEATVTDDQKTDWTSIRQSVEAFVADYRDGGKSLILFAGREGLDNFTLPITVENQSYFGEPFVVPLYWALDEYEPYLVALVDQQQARFLVAHLGSGNEDARMEIDLDEYDFREKTLSPATSYGKQLNQGSNRDAFEATIDDHRTRFYRAVADEIQMLCERHEADRIVLGGGDAAHAVRNLMSDTLVEKVVDVLPIPMRATEQEVLERLQPAAYAYERAHEKELLTQVIDFAKSGGRGALGRKAVMDALQQQRVELLILPYPMDDQALMEQMTQLVMQSSGSIEFVHDNEAERLRQEGGVAARLYYAL
jgi:hypothetical protein